MDFAAYGFQAAEVGEYTYNYRYGDTTVQHHMREYCQQDNKTRIVVLEKETRRGDNFVRLPRSLWITRDGYPPLSTDGALQQVGKNTMTLYYAGLPTVQSREHISIFDDAMRRELRDFGLDYDQLSAMIKSGQLFSDCTITGFVHTKKGVHDPGLIDALQDRALKCYALVLQALPCPCPIERWTNMIMGPQADFEYHLFKKWGFDVPLSAQRAFFTMMVGPRSSFLKTNDELNRLDGIAGLSEK